MEAAFFVGSDSRGDGYWSRNRIASVLGVLHVARYLPEYLGSAQHARDTRTYRIGTWQFCRFLVEVGLIKIIDKRGQACLSASSV
jgi:hypothetical protein